MIPALAGIFLLSGAAALIYQVVWLRMLSLVFGVTVYAASAVLTSFMGGLAIGSWVGGRHADRQARPLRAFALVEIGIAISAMAVPFVLDAVSAAYVWLHGAAPDALPLLTFARLTCSAVVLLVPTCLMGMSLPLLARYATQGGDQAATRVAWLYAANTAGGIAGTLAAGFVLIGAIGLTATTWLAAGLNLASAVGAFALGALRPETRASSSPIEAPITSGQATGPARAVLWVVFVAGLAGLALEVVWFRLLTLFLNATTYAFTTMLATVLLGIASGSALAARRVRRLSDPVQSLARIQIWTGVAVVLSMTALAFTYRLGWRTSGMIQACVVAMLPATMLMGATFPYAVAIRLGGASRDVGRTLGGLYAVNVLGAVAGSLAGGFAFLPLLGSRTSLLLLAALYVASGVLFLLSSSGADRRRVVRTAGVGVTAFLVAVVTLPDLYGFIADRRYARERLLFHQEGGQTTVAVHVQPAGNRVMYLDGLHQADDSPEMVRLHAEIGQLPMVLHAAPRRALVVGVGGGVTAGAVAVHAGTTVDIVELAASVVSAVPLFAHVNGGLLERPNVHLRIDDGRNFLRLTGNRYDVITADLIQPIYAGAGSLYSVEYFRLARQALADGGLMMQWIGHREAAHYQLIMRTFLEAFPHATLWSDGTLMVGSVEPLRLHRAAFESMPMTPAVRDALALVGLSTFDDVLARYTAGPDEMRGFVGRGDILTDDRPLLEFHRSLRQSGAAVDVSSMRGDVRRHLERR